MCLRSCSPLLTRADSRDGNSARLEAGHRNNRHESLIGPRLPRFGWAGQAARHVSMPTVRPKYGGRKLRSRRFRCRLALSEHHAEQQFLQGATVEMGRAGSVRASPFAGMCASAAISLPGRRSFS